MAGKIHDAQQRAIRQMTHFWRVGQMPETKTAVFAAQNEGTRESRPAKYLKTTSCPTAAGGGLREKTPVQGFDLFVPQRFQMSCSSLNVSAVWRIA